MPIFKGVYIIEINKIYNMCCLEGMKEIEDKSIDMILCDLPYGTTACKWDSIIPFDKLWEQYNRICRGVIALTASQPFTTNLIASNMDNFRYELIWDKQVGMGQNAKRMPIKIHENIVIFYARPTTYNPQMTDKIHKRPRPTSYKSEIMDLSSCKRDLKHLESMKKYPVSILSLSGRSAEVNSLHRVHPTQKPVALFEYLIKTYTNENEIVLDNCMGSGTTAIACINSNRNYIGFELDTGYFNIANERIEQVNAL